MNDILTTVLVDLGTLAFGGILVLLVAWLDYRRYRWETSI